MKKKSTDDKISIDLSGLSPKDREIIRSQLLRAQQFVKDTAAIRAVNPEVADKLVTSFNSNQASVFAESEIIGEKVRKGNVTLLSVSPHSTDAFYLQQKIGGIYTRQEIKSIIQSEASAVDKEITNAEVQHRDRLNDEKGKPTWHKTTVVIGNADNPWPFSSMHELEEAKGDRLKLLIVAATRIDRLLLGSMQPTKEIKREPGPLIKRRLQEAEERSKKLEEQPVTPMKREPNTSISKQSQPPTVMLTKSSQSSKHVVTTDKKSSAPDKKSEEISVSSKDATKTGGLEPAVVMKLPSRRPIQSSNREVPLSPISALEKERDEARSKVVKKYLL